MTERARDGVATRQFDGANHPDLTGSALEYTGVARRLYGVVATVFWPSAAADLCFSHFDAVLVISDGLAEDPPCSRIRLDKKHVEVARRLVLKVFLIELVFLLK